MAESPKSVFRQIMAQEWQTVLQHLGYTSVEVQAGPYTDSATHSLGKDLTEIDGWLIRIEIENRDNGPVSPGYQLSTFVQSNKGDGWNVIAALRLPFGRWDLLKRLEDMIYSQSSYDALYGRLWNMPKHLTSMSETRFEAYGLVEQLLQESPEFKTLKANQKKLSDEERQAAGKAPMKKSVIRGKTWYWSNTHRCYQVRSGMKAAVAAYWKIVEPSG